MQLEISNLYFLGRVDRDLKTSPANMADIKPAAVLASGTLGGKSGGCPELELEGTGTDGSCKGEVVREPPPEANAVAPAAGGRSHNKPATQ